MSGQSLFRFAYDDIVALVATSWSLGQDFTRRMPALGRERYVRTLSAAACRRSATRSGVSPLLMNASAPAESAA